MNLRVLCSSTEPMVHSAPLTERVHSELSRYCACATAKLPPRDRPETGGETATVDRIHFY